MSLAPASVESAFAMAMQQQVAGRTDDAQRMLLELTKRGAGDRRFWYELGHISYRTRRYDDALGYYRQAQAAPGGDPRALASEGAALVKLLRLDEAGAKYTRALTVQPSRAMYYQRLLMLAIYVYDVPEATAFIEKAPPRVMQEDAVVSTVAEFFLRTGEGDRALAELKRMPRDFFEDGWDWRPTKPTSYH